VRKRAQLANLQEVKVVKDCLYKTRNLSCARCDHSKPSEVVGEPACFRDRDGNDRKNAVDMLEYTVGDEERMRADETDKNRYQHTNRLLHSS
jgi:hypothetical protein